MLNRPKPKTLVACVEWYLEDCLVKGLSPRTIEGKRSSLNAFTQWALSERLKRPQQIGIEEIEAYQAYLFRHRQPFTQKPLQKPTIRNRLTAVKVLFRRLHVRGIIKENGLALMELPKVPRQLPKGYLDVEEIEATLQQSLLHDHKGLRDRAMLAVFYATGIRRMELANLNVDDVDVKTGVVTVHKGKGEKDRRVPIALSACTWVQLYLKHVRPKLQQLHSGSALFLDNKGLKFREHQVTRIVSKYVQRAGINKPGACNLFRHSTATLMHENGADIRVVQDMLGHADISTTQIYTHVAINHLKRVYAETHPAALNAGRSS
ncbi:tyrosine-type recombinase/integrase [Microbulbifer spongiae]|uniref:Tyrosine-type recombinase/integrase n=1 Tax=Microbulbifer spongiae TaxID=2944933 RepID=A0ABY9EEX9_9GAMM|nr:tyrosine-type recombinase/integrase [Microbulbifer sp. MI-G]WKD51040.1 tyrosine-type recombinase/integrase [Microbulbifer sp. MI-G]